ncbi:response regulator [Lacticaseibacillus suihuaensis]
MTTHVMIVEDDPMVRELNAQYLRRVIAPSELAVSSFGNAAAALAAAATQPVDLILLDVYMPELTGDQLLSELTAAGLHPQVIMLTAASDMAHIRPALDYGVLDYLVKPFTFARFSAAIQRFLTFQQVTEGAAALSQDDLDHLFTAGSQPPVQEALPKGLSAMTLAKIRALVATLPQPFSNQELAKAAKLSRISTKKYLDYLLTQEAVSSDIKYLKVGRPITVYTSTAKN